MILQNVRLCKKLKMRFDARHTIAAVRFYLVIDGVLTCLWWNAQVE